MGDGTTIGGGDDTVVHALLAGLPLCDFTTDVPEGWPEGHIWVYVSEIDKITCEKCKTRAEELAL